MNQDDNAYKQAIAQMESISDMMRRYREAQEIEGYAAMEAVEDEIMNDPLEISVRSLWTPLGMPMEADEFRILLCTGGPAVQIVGVLDEHGSIYGQPRLEYQDWFTPWTNCPLTEDQQQDLLAYCQMFNFA